MTAREGRALMRPEEVERDYGIPARSLRTEWEAGRLKRRLIAGKVYYRQDDIEALIDAAEDSRCQDPAQAQPSSKSRTATRSGGGMATSGVRSALDQTAKSLIDAGRKSPSRKRRKPTLSVVQ